MSASRCGEEWCYAQMQLVDGALAYAPFKGCDNVPAHLNTSLVLPPAGQANDALCSEQPCSCRMFGDVAVPTSTVSKTFEAPKSIMYYVPQKCKGECTLAKICHAHAFC